MMRGEGDNPTEDKYTVQGGVGGLQYPWLLNASEPEILRQRANTP